MSKLQEFYLGNTLINFLVQEFSLREISFIHLHENEQTAVEAALKCKDKMQGKFAQLQFEGSRNICLTLEDERIEFDPNRIFTEAGVVKTLEEFNSYSEKAAQFVVDFGMQIASNFIDQRDLVISIHNNTAHGDCSIAHYELGQDVEAIHTSENRHADDFFFVTEAAFFDFFKKEDFNVVLQGAKPSDDGSLSVYCGARKIPYINIEAQHGHLDEQVEMLLKVTDIL